MACPTLVRGGLALLLDIESGICDATLATRHVDVVVDLYAALDVEAGLAAAIGA